MNFFQKAYNYITHLQLENYHLERFWRVAWAEMKKKSTRPLRQKPDWTVSLKIIVFLAALVALLDLFILWVLLPNWGVGTYILLLVLLTIEVYLFFVYLLIVTWLLKPLDYLRKQKTINQAKQKMFELKDVTVIGIVGSYGKTTTKTFLEAGLGICGRVVGTVGNENTDIGIARRIISELDDSIDFFVVELGEFVPGDIHKICKMVKLDHVIITGINEAHLERMGNLETTIATIFEAPLACPEAKIYLNQDDENAKRGAQEYLSARHKVIYFSSQESDNFEITENKLLPETLQRSLTIKHKVTNKQDQIILNNIASYTTQPLLALYEVLQGCDCDLSELPNRLAEQSLIVPHRLQANRSGEVISIDDTYNGNPQGVLAGLELLKEFPGRKIYITPGLVELGEKNAEVHEQLGREIAKTANLVGLVMTSASDFIKKGLLAEGFAENKILYFDSMPQAMQEINIHLIAGDVVLYQNDWPDNYE